MHEVFAAEDDGCGAVREGGGVWGGDGPCAVSYEGWFHGFDLFFVQGGEGFFVLGDYGWGFASRAGDGDGGDFVLEFAGGGGRLGFLDRADGVFVLFFPAEGVVPGALFGLQAHVLRGVGVAEAVAEETVHQGDVAELCACPRVGEVVRGVRHGFGAAGYDAGGCPCHDGLGG